MIHHSLITHSIIVKLVGILLLLHIVCWTTVYYLALKYRLIQYPYLFLSTAFGSDPARAVAAFILPMISVLTGLLLGMRSALIKPRIKTRIQRRLMFAFNVCIILTCVGLLGVSAISIYTNIYVHLIFAFIVFISGILIMLLSTYFDSILKLPVSTFVQSIRYALTVVAVVSGICLGVFFVPYPFLGSLMEMIATGSMTAYFVTFAHKLESVDVPIVAELEQMVIIASSEVIRGERKFVRVLIFLMLLSRIIFESLAYYFAAVNGVLEYPNFGVSNTYSTDPMRALATFLLPISGMLIVVVVGLRMRRIRAIVHTVPQWTIWWIILFALSCSTFGLFGVATVPKNINRSLFYVFATFWYIGSVLQICLSTVLNTMTALVQPKWLERMRLCLTVALLVVALLLACTYGWLPLVESIASILLSIITVSYFATYAHQSGFPYRSNCPFVSLSAVPPVPMDIFCVYMCFCSSTCFLAMKHFNEPLFVRIMIGIYLGVGLLWLALIYSLAGANHSLDSDRYFPSKVMTDDPERMVGAFLLPFTAGCSATFIGMRLYRMRNLLQYATSAKLVKWLFRISIGLLIVATITMVGVGAISLGSSELGHYVAAFFLFSSTPFLLLFITIMDDLIRLDRPRWLRLFRIWTSTLVFLIAVIMVLVRKYGAVFSALEILVIIHFSVYFTTFAHGSDFVMKSTTASRCEISSQLLQPARCSIVQNGETITLRAD